MTNKVVPAPTVIFISTGVKPLQNTNDIKEQFSRGKKWSMVY